MDITTTQLIDSLLLPPGGPVLLAFIGLIMWKLGFGRRLFVLAFLLLWLSSLPVTEKLLFAGLETYPALDASALTQEDATTIVLLGASRYLDAPEYGGDTAGPQMLMRVRYAAKLAKRLNLGVIPSGGITNNKGKAEAQIYAEILRNEYDIKVDQIEARSLSTWENARYTAQLMKKLEIKKFLLVTDAAHMSRAMYAFQRNGLTPIAAPTGFHNVSRQTLSWQHLLPNADALMNTTYALHEYLGLILYRVK